MSMKLSRVLFDDSNSNDVYYCLLSGVSRGGYVSLLIVGICLASRKVVNNVTDVDYYPIEHVALVHLY